MSEDARQANVDFFDTLKRANINLYAKKKEPAMGAFNNLKEKLEESIVISEEFKGAILGLVAKACEEAHAIGKKQGIEKGYSDGFADGQDAV